MEEVHFDFTSWTEEQLIERNRTLGEHIVACAEDSDRRKQMSREISHIVFELTERTTSGL